MVHNLGTGTHQITLTVTDNQGAVGRDTVTVNIKAVPVRGVDLLDEDVELNVWQTAILTAKVLPAEATDRSLNWSSDSESPPAEPEASIVNRSKR
jgi:uncharacterized protein YjdB